MNENLRYNIIEENIDKSFDQLYIEFRTDVDKGILYASLDTLSSILLKFNKQIEEIKQCLATKKDKEKPIGYGDFFPQINKGEQDE